MYLIKIIRHHEKKTKSNQLDEISVGVDNNHKEGTVLS